MMWKYDKVVQVNYWDISKKCGFEVIKSWCNYKQKFDLVGDFVKCKFLWVFKIYVDYCIVYYKFDIVFLGMEEIFCFRQSVCYYLNQIMFE